MGKRIAAAGLAAALAGVALTPAHAQETAPELPQPASVAEEPGYDTTAVLPGFDAVVPAPLPRGAAWFEATSLPDWAELNTADGSIRLNPGADVTPGTYEFPVKAIFNDETTRTLPARVVVGNEGAPAGDQGAVIDAFVAYAPEVSKRCAATALGVGLPLLVLLPLGFASQLSLPLVAKQNALNVQVENLNIDLRLRDLNTRDLDMGIAVGLTLAGIAGAGAIISQCD